MGYGLAPSQQSADTETGATPSLGESFLVQFFLLVFEFCILREAKNQLEVRLRWAGGTFCWGISMLQII